MLEIYKLRMPSEKTKGADSKVETGGQSGWMERLPELIDAMERSQEEYLRIRQEMAEAISWTGGGYQV